MQFKRLFSPIQLGVIRIYPDNPIIYHQQIPSLKKKSIAPSTCFLLSRGEVLPFFIWLRLVKYVGSFQWVMFMLSSWDRNLFVFVLNGLLSCSVIAFDCCMSNFDTDYIRLMRWTKRGHSLIVEFINWHT